jgi:Flp pilus assembly protein TadB
MTDVLTLTATSALTGGAVGFGSWAGVPALDRLNDRALRRLRPQVDEVGGDVARLPELLRWWRAATVGVGLLVWFGLGMPPVAVFLAFVVHQAGPLLVEFWAANRRKRITEQAATAARGLAAQVRVGVTLAEGLAAVARGRRRWPCSRCSPPSSYKAKAERRVGEVRARLPFAMDLMALLLEAGAGTLRECFERAGDEHRGQPLGDEIRRTLFGVEKGADTADMLRAMDRRFVDARLDELPADPTGRPAP